MSPERAFEQAVRQAADAAGFTIGAFPIAYPPTAAQGDLATPVCFDLARTARRPPRAIAEAIAAAFVPQEGLVRLEAAGNGYLNAFFDRPACLRRWLILRPEAAPASGGKIIVEHTNINPNKAAHIGHLRNAVLGDTLVRCLRQIGRRVEVQNYIDDTGVQVADLVVGFLKLRGESLEAVKSRYAEPTLAARGERFDYLAWDLYAEVTRWYDEDKDRLAHRQDALHAMERGANDVAALAGYLAQRMVRHHLRTMHRIGARYDLLPKESDIIALHFWNDAFSRLKEAGAVHRLEVGKNAGCWVMDLPGVDEGAGEDQKVIVRSNGTVTYVGKDIAYQMWKFGRLGREFRYVPFDWGPERKLYDLWATTSLDGAPDAPSFGSGETVYNVIDSRQAYLQRVVAAGLRSIGYADEAERSVHFAYEMVALTPAAVTALFPEHRLSDDDRKKPYLEMSGRKGLGVRADDLLDALWRRAEAEVALRNPDQDKAASAATAGKIAVGALRYYMLRFSRNRVVAFDFDDALAFEGETGPYLQYSVVRAKNILAKLAERREERETDAAWLSERVELGGLPEDEVSSLWEIPLLLSRTDAVIRQAVESLELATVAKHAYNLAQAFNSFYHRAPVAKEDHAALRLVRAAVTRLYLDGMTHLLAVMGIEVPDRM